MLVTQKGWPFGVEGPALLPRGAGPFALRGWPFYPERPRRCVCAPIRI